MSKASPNEGGGDNQLEVAEELEGDVAASELTETGLETVSADEGSLESVYELVDFSGDVLYAGAGFEGSEIPEGDFEVITVDPWAEDGGDPFEPPTEGMSGAIYVIDGSMAEVLASQDWETERLPLEARDGVQDDGECSYELARKLASEWAESLSDLGELAEIVLVNDVHFDPGMPPVNFDYDHRRNGGEDVVTHRVFASFLEVFEDSDSNMDIEYLGHDDRHAEAYLAV